MTLCVPGISGRRGTTAAESDAESDAEEDGPRDAWFVFDARRRRARHRIGEGHLHEVALAAATALNRRGFRHRPRRDPRRDPRANDGGRP